MDGIVCGKQARGLLEYVDHQDADERRGHHLSDLRKVPRTLETLSSEFVCENLPSKRQVLNGEPRSHIQDHGRI